MARKRAPNRRAAARTGRIVADRAGELVSQLMERSPSPPCRSAIVTRLRAAGCVFAEDEAQLLISAARTPADLAAMVDRRAAGLPLEHVLGWAEFCGLRIAMDPGVFVPRRRTEFLVRQAAALARQAASPAGQARHQAHQPSSTCAAARARWAPRWPRRWAGSSCTPPTSTPPRCGAPAATSRLRWPGVRR